MWVHRSQPGAGPHWAQAKKRGCTLHGSGHMHHQCHSAPATQPQLVRTIVARGVAGGRGWGSDGLPKPVVCTRASHICVQHRGKQYTAYSTGSAEENQQGRLGVKQQLAAAGKGDNGVRASQGRTPTCPSRNSERVTCFPTFPSSTTPTLGACTGQFAGTCRGVPQTTPTEGEEGGESSFAHAETSPNRYHAPHNNKATLCPSLQRALMSSYHQN